MIVRLMLQRLDPARTVVTLSVRLLWFLYFIQSLNVVVEAQWRVRCMFADKPAGPAKYSPKWWNGVIVLPCEAVSSHLCHCFPIICNFCTNPPSLWHRRAVLWLCKPSCSIISASCSSLHTTWLLLLQLKTHTSATTFPLKLASRFSPFRRRRSRTGCDKARGPVSRTCDDLRRNPCDYVRCTYLVMFACIYMSKDN